MAGSALIIEFTVTIACKFPDLETLDDGSFYIEVLDFGDIAFCADIERTDLQESKKKLVQAVMWEAELAFSYELDSDGENWLITVEGGMAAEVADDEWLEDLDLNEISLEDFVISWAQDGDSPRVVGQESEIEYSEIAIIEISDDFAEYP